MMNKFTTPLFYVFIDETGSITSGTRESNLYICTAVIVSENNLQQVINGLESINQKHRNGAILKSSAVGSNHTLRIAILKDLLTLNFQYVFLLTDKNKIDPNSGLKYKKTRYKFIHNRLNQLINENNCDLKVYIDKYGTQEFQDECLKYFEKKETDLFGGDIVREYADDEDQTVLQIADFIGGSLLYCFDKDRKNECSDQIRALLKEKESGYEFFPRGIFETIPSPVPDEKLQEQLFRYLYNKAVNFLDDTEDSTEDLKRMQFETLNRLFLARNYEEPTKQSIYSDELFKDLQDAGFVISKRAFTVNVVGGLRRAGIIIAGSPNGYKLALTLDDINEYLMHDDNIIFPMLAKLSLAKKTVHSLIGYNILQGSFNRFDTVLTSLADTQIQQYTAEPDIEKIEMIQDEEEIYNGAN